MPPRKHSSSSSKKSKRKTKTSTESSSDVEGTPENQEGNGKTSIAKAKEGSNKVSFKLLSEEIHTPDINQGSSERLGDPSAVMPDKSRNVDGQSVPTGLEDDSHNAPSSSSRSVIREQQPPGVRTRQSLRQKLEKEAASIGKHTLEDRLSVPKGLKEDSHNAASSSSRSVIREQSLPPGFTTRYSLRQKFQTRLQNQATSIGTRTLEDRVSVPKGLEDDSHNAANSSSRSVMREQQPPGVRTRNSLKQKFPSVSNRLSNESSSTGKHTHEDHASPTDASAGKNKEIIKEEKELASVGSGILKNHGSSLSSLSSWKTSVKAGQSGKADKQSCSCGQSCCHSGAVISEAKEATKPTVQSGIPVENRRNTIMNHAVYHYIMKQRELIEKKKHSIRLSQEHRMQNNTVAHIKWEGINHREVEVVGEICWLCETDVGAGREVGREEHEFQNAPEISVLSCGHVFHSDCLFTILDEQTIDPLCVLCASLGSL